MNEQLQQALVALLNKTAAGVEAGTAFLSAEIPDVIQQLLMWKAISSVVIFVLASAFLVLCIMRLRPWAIGFIEYQRGSSLYCNNSGELEAEGRRIMREKGAAFHSLQYGYLFQWSAA